MPRAVLIASLAGLGVALLIAAAFLWVRSPVARPEDTPAILSGPETASFERGRALFVAKGCIGCHFHKEANLPSWSSHGSGGPNLSDIDNPYTLLHNDVEYLRTWLRDPWVKNPNRVMPELDLSEEEIESLLAFLLPSRRTP